MGGEARITITVAPDGLSASALIRRGDASTRLALEEALQKAGVVFGVDEALVGRFGSQLGSPRFEMRATVIAKGRAAVPGKSGVFVPAFEMGLQPGRPRPDGSIDFHDRDLLKHVETGAKLGTLQPPTAGVAGMRVDGKEIPAAPGVAYRLSVGKGARLAPDGVVWALRGGVVGYNASAGSIDVEDHHIHSADVDLHSGDVRMEGSLVIQGSVEETLEARATGDLEILGRVEGGRAEAGGSLRVKGGVFGVACARGDLVTQHATAANLRCGGLLRVSEAVNSQLHATRIEITRLVRGGAAFAEQSIVVTEAGSPQGITTELVAGEPLDRELLAVRKALEATKKGRLVDRRASHDSSGKVGRASAALDEEALNLKIALLRRRAELAPAARVEVIGLAHPGVVVRIGDERKTIDEPMRGVRISLDPETRQLRFERIRR